MRVLAWNLLLTSLFQLVVPLLSRNLEALLQPFGICWPQDVSENACRIIKV